MKDRIETVADVLMAAAYADDRLEGEEKAQVKRLLKDILGASLPMDLEFRIDEFDPKAFDLAKAAAAFASDAQEDKRKLLELVGAVHAADSEFDLAEDEFVHRLAAALGLAEDEYRDLASTVVEEIDLADALERARFAAE